MKRRKKVLISCCIIVGVFVILDFIPIKYASRLSDFSDNANTSNVYICEHTAVTGGDWFADKELNPWLTESTDFILLDNKVFENISKMYSSDEAPVYNLYVYWGTMRQRQVTENFTINILNAEKWNIIYPIQRNSIRGFYAPKGYFTIYDFNWIKVIKKIFS